MRMLPMLITLTMMHDRGGISSGHLSLENDNFVSLSCW